MKKFFIISLGVLGVLAGLVFAWVKYEDAKEDW